MWKKLLQKLLRKVPVPPVRRAVSEENIQLPLPFQYPGDDR